MVRLPARSHELVAQHARAGHQGKEPGAAGMVGQVGNQPPGEEQKPGQEEDPQDDVGHLVELKEHLGHHSIPSRWAAMETMPVAITSAK